MSDMKTFVFTDIVKSVDLKGEMAGRSDAERDEAFVTTVLTPHRARIEAGLAAAGGRVVSTAGDGHFLVFANTINAAAWAIAVQKSHREEPISTPRGTRVTVRMSLHVGFPQKDPHDPDNFIGRVVDYAARLADYATGEQVLCSTAALGLLKDAGLEGVRFHPHGARDLRGIGAVDVYELLYDGGEPRPTRDAPKQDDRRTWTVLPPTMGLTEYALHGGSHGAVASPPDRTAATPRTRLGNYELGDLLGAGGMGDVYKARHVQFDRVRAIKVIKPQFLASGAQGVIHRFYREIKAVGALDHPNIVVAVDSSAPGDATHYLVMEYVHGVSADVLVKRAGPLAAADACEIARQAAVGLEYIHSQNMVHRDIKPSNLMVTLAQTSGGSSGASAEGAEPLVKILDLGLALLADEDQSRLTHVDHGAMGTAMYMSPEQWRTTTVDIRSDIYSLGCSLYHMLVGSPPFFDSDLKPEKAHERLAPPSLRRQTDAPKALDAVVRKMMAKSPTQRYQSPTEVAEALAPLAEGADLATLVRRFRAAPDATTQAGHASDTLAAGRTAGETRRGRGSLVDPSWPTSPAERRWSRALVALALVAALGAVGWGVWLARSNRAELLQAHRRQLTNVAQVAAPLLSAEIDSRINTLVRLARDPALLEMMQRVSEDPDDPARWAPLAPWLEEQKRSADIPSNSWFITNAQGTQIARAPYSDDSYGGDYSGRDYFHGRGRNLGPEELAELSAPPQPIKDPHQSAVYRSDTSNQLKVAFSVPIWNGAAGAEREVLGVLAMSVNIGDIHGLEKLKQVRDPLEVLVVDLREDTFPGGQQRGLVLHHRDLTRYDSPTRPLRLPAETTQKILAKLGEGRLENDLESWMVEGYPDILGRDNRRYWGAFEPIVRSDQTPQDAPWLLIIQEPMP